MSNAVFKRVAGLHPGMSVFDLSYTKLFTCDMGKLIPVMCDEVVPGDIFKIGNQSVIRMQPLVAPVLHEINAYVHYFLFLIVSCGTVGRLLLPVELMVLMRLHCRCGLHLLLLMLDRYGIISVFLLVLCPLLPVPLYRFLLPRII